VELGHELQVSVKKCQGLAQKEEELEEEIIGSKHKILEQQKYIKELEVRDISLKNEYGAMVEKQGEGDGKQSEQQKRLEQEIRKLEQENLKLKGKVEVSNGSVGTFISEMNTLLDSNELQSILNMEVDSDEEEEELRVRGPDPVIDIENEEKPHSGTGGSSKMKSRPNLNSQQLVQNRPAQLNNAQIIN